jgi:hypothetical protein
MPPITVAHQQLPVIVLLTGLGLSGTFLRKHALLSITYAVLVLLSIWGKTVGDLFAVPGPDTALFLLQFIAILFLYEVSFATILFEQNNDRVKDRYDELSSNARDQITRWYASQIRFLGKMIVSALALSLGLVVLGGFVSVAFNQLAFAAVLVIGSVIVLLFLLTHLREPRSMAE